MEDEQGKPGEEAAWLDLNFVPQWARRSPGANPYADAAGETAGERAPRREGRRERPARFSGGDRRGSRGMGGPRRPDDRRQGDGPRRPVDGDPAVRRPRMPGREPERAPWLPLEVSFLPERSALRGVVRRIQASHRAYPLPDLAAFFLSNDAFHEVKIEVRREAEGATSFHLFRCRGCGLVSGSRPSLVAHAVAKHAEDVLEREEIDEGLPSGRFVCVTRCRSGGHLVGPPNHHLYAERLAEIRMRCFPGVTEEAFQAQLETVRDPDLIEQWKESVRIRRVYRRKDAPDAAPMDASAAQAWLEAAMEREQIQPVRRAILPAGVARGIEDPGLRRAVGEAWAREERFPRTTLLALRPALRHLGLHLFRAGAHAWFVTALVPSAVSPDHAVEPVRRILEYIQDQPGIHRGPMLNALLPGVEPEHPDLVGMLRHLQWLVAKGHVIEFSDGALSIPRRPGPGMREKDHG